MLILVGMAIILNLGGCSGEDPAGPVGQICNNLSGTAPCSDCNATNPEHLACYDAFTREVIPVLERRCLGCHNSGGPGEFETGGDGIGLNVDRADLQAVGVYQRLLMPSYGDSGATLRIVPGNPEASALYNKITADANAVWFGNPMPQGQALINFDPAGVDVIRRWIARGAKPPATSATAPSRTGFSVHFDTLSVFPL